MPPEPMHDRTRKSHAPEETKRRLVEAGLELFGRYSFDGVSTRDLADRADVNLAAIQYYFGSKEGLYLAVARYIVEHVSAWMTPEMARVDESLKENPDKETCFVLFCELFDQILGHMLRESEHMRWMGIFTQEQVEPTGAFDILYDGIMKPLHDCFCRLVAYLLEMPAEDQETKVRAYAVFGQALMFHVSRAEIDRVMNWKGYDTEGIELIRRVVLEHLRAILDMPRDLLKVHLARSLT
jgi:AcrR family transcriptional regulator